jgi:hypothetical protein
VSIHNPWVSTFFKGCLGKTVVTPAAVSGGSGVNHKAALGVLGVGKEADGVQGIAAKMQVSLASTSAS